MTVATLETGYVGCARLADGMVVQLGGELTDDYLPALRQVLLRPMPSHCRDVVVDAGEVTVVSPAALAVLVAANEWAVTGGRRFLLSRSSTALDEALLEYGVEGGLPRLHALDSGRRAAAGEDASDTEATVHMLIPRPRATADC